MYFILYLFNITKIYSKVYVLTLIGTTMNQNWIISQITCFFYILFLHILCVFNIQHTF